jgi:hypothetical protein
VAIAPAHVVEAAPVVNAFEPEGCEPEVQKTAAVPPLQVDIVAARPIARNGKSTPAAIVTPEQSSAHEIRDAVSALTNPDPTSQSSCSRYPSVHIPTQLHPRVNPLMTSNQVFTEKGTAKSTQRIPHR